MVTEVYLAERLHGDWWGPPERLFRRDQSCADADTSLLKTPTSCLSPLFYLFFSPRKANFTMHYFSQLFHYECVSLHSGPPRREKLLLTPWFLLRRHPWSHVVIGMWHKYPNPHCSHVVTIDVLDRSVDPKTGVIRTERILGCKQKAPIWIVKVRSSSTHSHLPF